MDILQLFVNFVNNILNFELFDIKLSVYLLTISLVLIIIGIIRNIAE